VQPVTQAKMVKMVKMVMMATLEAQERTLLQTITSCQYPRNATATHHQVALATQDQKDLMEHRVMLDRTEAMANQVLKVQQAHQVQLEKLATKEQKDLPAMLEFKKMVPPAQQAQQVKQVRQEHQDQQGQPVVQEKMVNQADQGQLVMLVPLAVKANQEAQAVQEKMVVQVPRAHAPTVHQHVWLQVINTGFDHMSILYFFMLYYRKFTKNAYVMIVIWQFCC